MFQEGFLQGRSQNQGPLVRGTNFLFSFLLNSVDKGQRNMQCTVIDIYNKGGPTLFDIIHYISKNVNFSTWMRHHLM